MEMKKYPNHRSVGVVLFEGPKAAQEVWAFMTKEWNKARQEGRRPMDMVVEKVLRGRKVRLLVPNPALDDLRAM